MPTVFSSQSTEYVVERSRFIGQTFHFSDPERLTSHLRPMMSKYPGANHYTWAYRLNESQERASDNGEPRGTAGLPMLRVLTQEDWRETLVIVVRYFGGIKLGRGGLVHAYQKAAQLALQHTNPGSFRTIRTAQVQLDYGSYHRLRRPIEALVLHSKSEFTATVDLTLTLDEHHWFNLKDLLDQEARGQWTLIKSAHNVRLMPLNETQNESEER